MVCFSLGSSHVAVSFRKPIEQFGSNVPYVKKNPQKTRDKDCEKD